MGVTRMASIKYVSSQHSGLHRRRDSRGCLTCESICNDCSLEQPTFSSIDQTIWSEAASSPLTVADLPNDHERHACPPHGAAQVRVPFTCDEAWLVLHGEQAFLLEDERRADEDAREDGEDDADNLQGHVRYRQQAPRHCAQHYERGVRTL